MIYLLIVFLIVALILWLCFRYVINDDTVSLFTGSNGSGKTFFSLCRALSCFARLSRKVFFHNMKEFISLRKNKDYWEQPRFFSNIPVKLGFFKPKFCEPLKLEHILLKERLPHRCVVFIDEINLLISQMKFKIKEEKEINTWTTLFRHITHGGYLIMNTQNYNKVHWIFRYCVGYVHNLSSCVKVPHLFILTHCVKVNTSDDVKLLELRENKVLFSFLFMLPFKYDTYCFDDVYDYTQLPLSDKRRQFLSFKIKEWESL